MNTLKVNISNKNGRLPMWHKCSAICRGEKATLEVYSAGRVAFKEGVLQIPYIKDAVIWRGLFLKGYNLLCGGAETGSIIPGRPWERELEQVIFSLKLKQKYVQKPATYLSHVVYFRIKMYSTVYYMSLRMFQGQFCCCNIRYYILYAAVHNDFPSSTVHG